jgi:asparagine synthetase B (glutamine-hydrolysing)
MCGISVLYSKSPISNSDIYLKHRGPDSYSSLERDGFFMSHYLLHLTGDVTNQPIVDGDIYCVFNGEIYNYKDFGDFKSDSYAIIESYKRNGDSFVRELDGEFAIFLIDFKNKFIYISSDVFGIKPIYYSLSGGFGVSSYKSFLSLNGFNDIIRLEPNTTLKLNFNFEEISRNTVYDFNLNQYKNNFNDWNQAFIEAVSKRFSNTNYKIILPLSSGNDSGSIACALNLLNIDYISYSYLRNEDVDVINDRVSINSNTVNIINENSLDFNLTRSKLISNCEPFHYGFDYNDTNGGNGFDDPGALGLYNLLIEIKKDYSDLKILASGQGSDEIMSNLQAYKFRNPNPSVFPNNLESVFPWDNFYKGAQSSYLSKEEFITGSLGIEGRYPFLDKKVVQEFLSLSPELKNSSFKSPTYNFLSQNNYPINNIKKGFNPM